MDTLRTSAMLRPMISTYPQVTYAVRKAAFGNGLRMVSGGASESHK